ncbi:MAG: ComEC/Rec2 family competence protein [Fusobacteriaceae bacterium]
MDTVYLLAIEIFLGIFILNFLPNPYGMIVFILLILTAGVVLKRKIFFYWVIPAVFLISFLNRMDNRDYKNGDFLINSEVRLYGGRGEIYKIAGKFPQKKSMVIIDRIENGNYRVDGEIKKKEFYQDNVIYHLKVKNIDVLKNGYFRDIFQRRNERLLQKSRNDQKNLFLAVVSGEKNGLFPRIKKLFVNSGTSHLLALSGMHLAILLAILEFVFKKTKLSKRGRNIFLLIGITLYFVSVRGSPSLQRAYIMVVIYLAGNIFFENSEMVKSLALAFIIGIILKPTAYRELSFVLSYWAMVIISFLIPFQREVINQIKNRLQLKNSYIERGVLTLGNYVFFTFLLQLGIVPIIYYSVGTFSLKSIFLSILITPIGTVYIILCFISLIFPIMPITDMWYNILIKSMEFFQ